MVHTVEHAPVDADRTVEPGWEPRIVALVCKWCTYAGADMAGTTRRKYEPNVRTMRFLCTGGLDPLFVLKAFERGVDGVLISGCHPGDCHYVQGNLLARRRFTVLEGLMEFLGLDQRRLQFAWISASEGVKWSETVNRVTEGVRLAGPLLGWGRPSTPVPEAPPFPSVTDEPPGREPPSDEEVQAVTRHLREKVAQLLGEEAVDTVIGYGPGDLPGDMVPAFVNRPEDADALAWNEHCENNLCVYLPEALKKNADGRVGVVAKACDARSVTGLVRESQFDRDRVVVLGVPCRGIWRDGRLAPKCHSCTEGVSLQSDWTMTPEGVQEGTAVSSEGASVAADPRDAQLVALEALPRQDRWDYWQHQFERCLRCYACKAVCPLCYCGTCVAEMHRPQWIPKAIDGPGNTAWNVIRAMHLAGRCVGCDECTRVCPADIRLDLLNRKVEKELENRFGYALSDNPETPPPLSTFKPDDPDQFG